MLHFNSLEWEACNEGDDTVRTVCVPEADMKGPGMNRKELPQSNEFSGSTRDNFIPTVPYFAMVRTYFQDISVV